MASGEFWRSEAGQSRGALPRLRGRFGRNYGRLYRNRLQIILGLKVALHGVATPFGLASEAALHGFPNALNMSLNALWFIFVLVAGLKVKELKQ